MTGKEKFETSASWMYFLEGILFIEFKPDSMVKVNHINEIIEKRIELQQGKKVLVLVDIRDLWQADKESRKRAASKDMIEQNIALAIITDSLPTRLLANFYMTFDKPDIPSKMFRTVEEGVEWLKSFE